MGLGPFDGDDSRVSNQIRCGVAVGVNLVAARVLVRM